MEVVEFTRNHTANVHESLSEIRQQVEQVVEMRDRGRDGFVEVVRKAMSRKPGDDADEAMRALNRQGITRALA